MRDIKNLKIAITGASGWIGKNLIEVLFSKLSFSGFRKNIYLYGSKDKELFIKNSTKSFSIKKLSKLKNDSQKINFDVIFHSAFFVRDYISDVGIEKYIDINRQITNTVLESIKYISNPKLILLSSGAASVHKAASCQSSLEKDPYGFLKREEEILFKNVADAAIFRVYGLSGKFMRNPNRFALGNFIYQAKKKGFIKIESEIPKIRGYVSAYDLSNMMLNFFLREKTLSKLNIINAVNEEISLLNLAKIISRKFGDVPILDNINHTLPFDCYSFSPKEFILLSKRLHYNLMNIEEQIDETILDLSF